MENPNFFLEGIVHEKDAMQDFEGPLSLILQLLSKNKIEIRDISISDILDQYLAWLEQAQSMDLEIASEFVQMAAQLLYIKTRTLLAADLSSLPIVCGVIISNSFVKIKPAPEKPAALRLKSKITAEDFILRSQFVRKT